ncbi:hypothetical protein Hte_011573 [Hypoxylon texense]
MFMNLTQPQPVWVGHRPDDIDYTLESHSYNRDRKLWHKILCQQFFVHCCCPEVFPLNDQLSQQQTSWEMDYQQPWFPQIAADSGDEANMADELDSDYLPRTYASTPYQTADASVSVMNPGRDCGPNHSQHNKELAGNDQTFLPNIPTANGYARGFEASYDPRQHPWQAYNTTGGFQAANYLDFSSGLPGSNWPDRMQVFGEPSEGPHVSSSSFSSSTPSSATSEAMTMSLGRVTAHANTTSSHSANNSVSVVGGSGNAWGASSPSTISPRALQIHPSPTPTSSSESIRTKVLTNSDPDFGSPVPKHRHPRSPLSPQRAYPRPRKGLPSKPGEPGKPRPVPTPPMASSDLPRRFRDKTPMPPQQPASPQAPSHRSRVAQLKIEEQEDMDMPSPRGAEGSSDPERSMRLMEGGRAAKDEFLIRNKLAGMTYKEIRRKGNFTEAESTLRGRFRTLTKDKEARVRKPEWQDNDIRLLRKAVRKLHKGDEMSPAKAPWGQVANYIADHGGSYHFGSATCHRKWKELVEDGRM